jgi:hypothetical protein
MSEVIARLFVVGRARTKGSLEPTITRMRGKLKIAMHDTPQSKAWKLRMVKALREALGITVARVDGELQRVDAEPYGGAVEVHAFFRFERSPAVAGGVWPSHDTEWPTADDIGDEDKLRRNVLDALTQAGVIKDDAYSIGGVTLKRWCKPGELAGVEILVRSAGAWAAHIEAITLADLPASDEFRSIDELEDLAAEVFDPEIYVQGTAWTKDG